MKKILATLVCLAALSAPAFAIEDQPTTLKKGVVLVQDFGESVGLDELQSALAENGIKATRIRREGRNRYRMTRVHYNGERYSMTIDRQTGEIDWVARYGPNISLFD